MKDFEKKQPLTDKSKTVNTPLGGTKPTDKTRQQPLGGGAGGIHNIPKTPTTGGTAGTGQQQRPWEKSKDQNR
ncbi:MAG TPA: hypothetical protein VLJ15_07900 [Gammaproteobacteria bacterium]|nr:hypothetical protein [Gammaproteobacteria bacterium]